MQNAATVRLQQTAPTVIVFCTPQIDLTKTREIAGRGLGPMQLHYSPSVIVIINISGCQGETAKNECTYCLESRLLFY